MPQNQVLYSRSSQFPLLPLPLHSHFHIAINYLSFIFRVINVNNHGLSIKNFVLPKSWIMETLPHFIKFVKLSVESAGRED